MMFFKPSRSALRELEGLQDLLDEQGNLTIRDTQQARLVAHLLNQSSPEDEVKAWQVYAAFYLKSLLAEILVANIDSKALLTSREIQASVQQYRQILPGENNELASLVELLTLSVLHQDSALAFLEPLFKSLPLLDAGALRLAFSQDCKDASQQENLLSLLDFPIQVPPSDLLAQLETILKTWNFLSQAQKTELEKILKFIYEEIEEDEKRANAPDRVLKFKKKQGEGIQLLEADWKRNIVLIAKNANVWLVQLSRKYRKQIEHLDQIPQQELDQLARWGINSLWLIGVWERSPASKRIKELYGNTDTTASAYSIKEYRIATHLGGEQAVDDLIRKCVQVGIKLCVDMVPNHTGVDSTWILQHSDWYISVPQKPVEEFRFDSPDLSPDPRKTIMLENGYYDQSGAAEVFLYQDNETGEKRYIYHGNDGTSMPWNDTAQLNYLNPDVREQIMRTILSILRKFPLIRFDAAMTLTKKHFQRLWYPLPESEERCIPTRENSTMTAEEFDQHMPREFWQEVVERVAQENPNAVLMAEAFWLMEGYFINELGMHRVYNSAFMNLLRDEQNDKYQQILKNALKTNPAILGRFVNFLNNPDERTAVDQFGKSEKYFAVCTLLATMPGLPMLGHGQIEGFEERYGMDFLTPHWDEPVDEELVAQHEKWFFPLLRMRDYFSDATQFHLFEVHTAEGKVEEDVYAYLTTAKGKYHLVIVNNSFNTLEICFKRTVPTATIQNEIKTPSLLAILPPALEKDTHLFCQEIRTQETYTFTQQELKEQGITFSLTPYQHIVWELNWNPPAEA